MKYLTEMNYSEMISELIELSKRNEILKLSYIGNSILSRPIPMLALGEGANEKGVIYISTHHATENLCTTVLMNFIYEYCEAYRKNQKVCGINARTLYGMRKIYIIPMLNPDGVEYRLNGIDPSCPLYERVMKYSGGDFSTWNANARGVDLNHNYDAYFEEYKQIEAERQITNGATKYSGEAPESEPEISALTNFIRYNAEQIAGALTLHSQGEEFYYKSRDLCPKKSEFIAKMISKMTTYKPSNTTDTASYGGFSDWFIKEFNKPSFTLECGKGKNPLPDSQLSKIYLNLRELLFTFPIII